MWQRVQTLYLGIATALVVALFWCDVASFPAQNGQAEAVPYTSNPIYLLWIILLTVLQVLSLGGYKWRMKQLRVVIFTALVSLGFQGFLAWDFFTTEKALRFAWSWTAVFPVCVSILDSMAARNILLDEAIVQSAGRLRKSRKK